MIAIIKTRLMLWKKSWVSLCFWLFMPLLLTIGVLWISSLIQEDAKIPVGIVIEEETALVTNLVEELENSSFLHIVQTSENEAKHLVETHELDSAFVIKNGYEEAIQNGNRNRLMIGYESDMSFAYTVTREFILSLMQKDSGRAKTVQTVHDVLNPPEDHADWSETAIVEKIIETENNQNLLTSKFSFLGEAPADTNESNTLFGNPWTIWAILAFLSTLFIFDWVMKEKQSSIISRLPFSRFSIKTYLLLHASLYLCLFIILDSVTLLIFKQIYQTEGSLAWLFYLISYRLTAVLFAFTLALCFRKATIYYAISLIIILFLTITSGVLVPMEGIVSRYAWIESLHPIQPFLTEAFWNPWLLILTCFIGLWFVKGEKDHA